MNNLHAIKKIMVIDDNEIDLFIAKSVLTSSGLKAKIVTHQSAQEALNELANISDDKEIPGLILLDIRMPVMDGFAFIEAFSESCDETLGKTRVYMLTSSMDPYDRERVDAHPYIQGMLTKPFTCQLCSELFTALKGSEA